MARILLDTGDLQSTADTFVGVDRELAGVLARLPADAATVMPPAVAAEVAGAVADTMAHVGQVAVRLLGSAADLRRRAYFAEVAEGGGGRGPSGLHRSGGFWGSLLGGGRAHGNWGFGGPTGNAFGLMPGLLRANPQAVTLLRGVYEQVSGGVSTFNKIITHTKLDDLGKLIDDEGVRNAYKWAAPIANNRVFKLAGNGLWLVGAVEGVGRAWGASEGETPVARSFTVAASVGVDVLLKKSVVLGGADFLSFGALHADLDAMAGMAIRGADEAVKSGHAAATKYAPELARGDYANYARHVAGGAIGGAAHGANVEINQWAGRVDDGAYGPVLQGISKVENYAIDKAYEPVSRVASNVSHVVGSGVDAASSGVHKLRSLF